MCNIKKSGATVSVSQNEATQTYKIEREGKMLEMSFTRQQSVKSENYTRRMGGVVDGGVAYVETTLPCATNVGYSMAPVVVAANPAMKLGPQGEPFRKVSICQHEAGYADLNAVADKLNEMEAGWGGSPTFKGSKQGESCNISLSDIKKTVFAHLTPEYKAKVTSNVGNANSGKGMGE